MTMEKGKVYEWIFDLFYEILLPPWVAIVLNQDNFHRLVLTHFHIELIRSESKIYKVSKGA